MKILILLLIGMCGMLCSCKKPPAVIHVLRPDIKFVTKKGYGYPRHFFYSRLICFDESCRKKSAWIDAQKKKGVKIKDKFAPIPPCKDKPEEKEKPSVRPSMN